MYDENYYFSYDPAAEELESERRAEEDYIRELEQDHFDPYWDC